MKRKLTRPSSGWVAEFDPSGVRPFALERIASTDFPAVIVECPVVVSVRS